MRDGLVLDSEDVKEALADYFGVSRNKVIKVEDLWVIIRDEIKEELKEHFIGIKLLPNIFGKEIELCKK